MAGIRYQISQNALRRVIDAGAKYVRWTGFVPVSPEFKQKIEDAEKITDAAIQQIDNLERRMEKIADRANKRFVRQATRLLKQSTGVPARVFEEFMNWPKVYFKFEPGSQNYKFNTELRNSSEIKLEPSILHIGSIKNLVHCPRLEARQYASRKGKHYDVKILDALKNTQGFAVTLYTPAPKFSRNYQMLKQFAALEQLIMQSAK